MKYILKLATLWHEIGHVDDAERGINFRFDGQNVDIIEAEVYANLFALEKLAEQNLRMSFNHLVDALRGSVKKEGHLGEVARRVVERIPEYCLTDWNEVLSATPLTTEEMLKLGPEAIEALQS